MTFNASQPENTTKIRNLGTVIRPNWKAIEEAESSFRPYGINLRDRTAPIQLDPAAIASPDAIILYCKKDDSGDQEFYLMYPSGNILKMTEDARNGSVDVGLSGSSLKFDSDTPSMTFGVNQQIMATGSFDSTGALLTGSVNISSTARDSEGNFSIYVAADVLLNANYRVIATVFRAGSSGRSVHIFDKATPVAATTTRIQLRVRDGSSKHDAGVDFIVVGGR